MHFTIHWIKIGVALYLLLFSFDSRAQSTGICDRTDVVETEILGQLKKLGTNVQCHKVSDAQLATISQIDLQYAEVISLDSEDFAGLTGLTRLHLAGNGLTSLHEDQFEGLANLEELILSQNSLTTLHEDQFEGLTNLKVLDLLANSY